MPCKASARFGCHTGVMRVLIVEDDVALARTMAVGLRRDGFEADVVNDGPTGLWRAREATYDAIVLDVMLPGTSAVAPDSGSAAGGRCPTMPPGPMTTSACTDPS